MPPPSSVSRIRSHVITVERVERQRWRVSVDGRRLFTFCSEARAREAGRLEAARIDLAAHERGGRGPGHA